MRRPIVRALSLSLLCAIAVGAYSLDRFRPHVVTTTAPRDPIYAGMVGHWQGTVESKDQHDATRRLTRSTRVSVSPVPESDALDMRFTTRNPLGPDQVDIDRLHLDNALTMAEWGGISDSVSHCYDVFVADSTSDQSPLQIVLQRERGGEAMPTTIRETVTIAPGQIRILQETRSIGGEFEFERAYVLTRIG